MVLFSVPVIAPSLDPITQPSVFAALSPDVCDSPDEFACVFLADVAPVVGVERAELAAVGTVAEVGVGDPAEGELVEEVLELWEGGGLGDDVVEVFVAVGEGEEGFAG